MKRLGQFIALLAFVFCANVANLSVATAAPDVTSPLAVPGPCPTGTLSTGALSMYCVPTSGWNGDLVIFAQGYVAYNQPLGFDELTLPDGRHLRADPRSKARLRLRDDQLSRERPGNLAG